MTLESHPLARRCFLRVAGSAAVVAAGATPAWPQAYPARAVRIIVPFSPGGAVDIIGRIVAQ
jgi:tripartite-type tricarboxylate transporter receptor subunit TctC